MAKAAPPLAGPNWRSSSQDVTVAVKKELFYRFLTPLILHANAMVLERRERLHAIEQQLAQYLGASRFLWLGEGLVDDETDGELTTAIVVPLRRHSTWPRSCRISTSTHCLPGAP